MENRRQLHEKVLLQDAKQKALLEHRLQIESNQRETQRKNVEYAKQKALLEGRLQMENQHRTMDSSSSNSLEEEEETASWLVNEFEGTQENSMLAKDGRVSVDEAYPKSKPSVYTPSKSAAKVVESIVNSYKTPTTLSYLDSLPRVNYPATTSAKATPLKQIERLINQDLTEPVAYGGAWDSVEEGTKKAEERVAFQDARLHQHLQTKVDEEKERAEYLETRVQQTLQKIVEVKATKLSNEQKTVSCEEARPVYASYLDQISGVATASKKPFVKPSVYRPADDLKELDLLP